ncbi:MAG: RidA family protein [Pseudomonadota bacterium]
MSSAADGASCDSSAWAGGRCIDLPVPPAPSANYLPYVHTGNVIQVAGVAPKRNGRYAFRGKLGDNLSLQKGYDAARLCALNALALLKEAGGGSLDHIERVVMVRGFVNATADFLAVPQVIDGASDLLVEVLGASVGRHARTSVGCATLPAGVAVEIDVLAAVVPTSTNPGEPTVPAYSWL